MQTTPAISQKFNDLLQLPKIERNHLNTLTPTEKASFLQMVHAKIPQLHGEELDCYIEQTSSLLDQQEIWEFNHQKIEVIIEQLVKDTGTMPSTTDIANATKLSRPTIRKHLTAINTTTHTADQNNSIALMVPRVMGTVLKQALRGDLKAAKVYMDAANKQNQSTPTVINQNNYLQINNIIINQQLISQLNPEQLKKIELIITGNDDKTE